jgi:hypothetical protein
VSFLAFLNADKTKEHCMSHHETAKTAVDALSVVTVVGTLTELLPAVAALFTIIWTAVRIWETDTVKSLTGRKNAPVE